MWGPSRPVAPEAEQQPVTWLTLPQHSNTVAETISCTDSPSPRERNRKCFLFLSRNNGAHTQPSPVERRIRHHFFFVSKLDRVCILVCFFFLHIWHVPPFGSQSNWKSIKSLSPMVAPQASSALQFASIEIPHTLQNSRRSVNWRCWPSRVLIAQRLKWKLFERLWKWLLPFLKD